MDISIHQTHQAVADFDNIKKYLVDLFNSITQETSEVKCLHVFPEMFLTGYPLQDICLQKSFIDKYKNFLESIDELSIKYGKLSNQSENHCFLIGGLKYIYDEEDSKLPSKIENVVYKLFLGKKLEYIYSKRLLPNYDIFEEKKYYTKGEKATYFEFDNQIIAPLICEDMWHSTIHNVDPVEDLFNLKINIDLVVNLSASPYNLYKGNSRFTRAKYISKRLQAPFLYVNRVGSEDEIIFDGGSFIVADDEVVEQLPSFEQAHRKVSLSKYDFSGIVPKKSNDNTWEGLFSPSLEFHKNELPRLKSLSFETCEELIKVLGFGVQEYAQKTGFNKFLIALSGGLDSVLVLALLKLSLKENQSIEAIYMPSEFSRDISLNISKEICEKAKIPLHVLPIKSTHHFLRDLFVDHLEMELEGLSDENIQSRLRGLFLYARSNFTNSLVINTSNKSELSVGYSTIYGDSVGAISLLGDLYKSEAYQLAKHIHDHYDGLVPMDVITRPPSAELRSDQVDTDSLPPYDRLDAIMEGILSYRLSGKDLVEAGFDKNEVLRVLNLYRNTEFKRNQFCPIIKLKSKSYGFGYRVPITKNSNYLIWDI